MSDDENSQAGSGDEEIVEKVIPMIEVKSDLKEGEFYPDDWVLSHKEEDPIEHRFIKFK